MGPNAIQRIRSAMRPVWGRWVELWYLPYMLLGVAAAGMVPILLPLSAATSGGAAHVGSVMAAVNAGGLTAPAWGWIADRHRLHRGLLTGGMLAAAASLAAFALIPAAWARFVLALVLGTAIAAAATVAALFVVEAHPASEWDSRIGWLQTFYAVGQIGGLVLAGALTQSSLTAGLLTAAALAAAGVPMGWLWTRAPAAPLAARPTILAPARHGAWSIASPVRLFHYVNLRTARTLLVALRSPFGRLALLWFAAFTGSSALFSLYPVMMRSLFTVAPSLSASAFAIATAASLLLYPAAGFWADKSGAARVLRQSLALRLIALVALTGLGLGHYHAAAIAPLAAFGLVVVAWPMLSVAGTALTAQLSPVGEGEGMGIFNAASALAGVVGALLGGYAAQRWGYVAVPAVGAAGLALGLALSAGRALPDAPPGQSG